MSETASYLSTERSAASMTNDRLSMETTERTKLESQLELQSEQMKNLQEYSDRIEMELLTNKSDFNEYTLVISFFILNSQ